MSLLDADARRIADAVNFRGCHVMKVVYLRGRRLEVMTNEPPEIPITSAAIKVKQTDVEQAKSYFHDQVDPNDHAGVQQAMNALIEATRELNLMIDWFDKQQSK